jgi:hypothetical protein
VSVSTTTAVDCPFISAGAHRLTAKLEPSIVNASEEQADGPPGSGGAAARKAAESKKTPPAITESIMKIITW